MNIKAIRVVDMLGSSSRSGHISIYERTDELCAKASGFVHLGGQPQNEAFGGIHPNPPPHNTSVFTGVLLLRR